MSGRPNSHHQHGDPNSGSVHRPYWTRAHRDWRVWVGVVLMLAAMMVYLMTNDLAGWFRKQSGELASVRLNAMNAGFKSRLPWGLAFSFARAIQQPAFKIWRGQEANVKAAQQALLHRY